MSGWKRIMLTTGIIFLLLMMSDVAVIKLADVENAKAVGYVDTKALIPHSPIYINNDTDFDSIVQSEGWNGTGTPDDPYIIEGYYISTSNDTIPIVIKNTTRYFVIRNCSISKANESSALYGIYFYNVTYGTIFNITVFREGAAYYYAAIWAEQITYIQILNSTIINSYLYGIYAMDGKIGIENNKILDDGPYESFTGIRLWRISISHISNNYIDAGYAGIHAVESIVYALYNHIKVKSDSGYPVYIAQTKNMVWIENVVEYNQLEGGGIGIYCPYLKSVYASYNNIRNTTYGIKLERNVYDGTVYITGNLISNTSIGISLLSYVTDSVYTYDKYISSNRIVNATSIGILLNVDEDALFVSDNIMDKGGIFLSPGGNYNNTTISSTNLINGRPVIFAKNSDMNGVYAPENAAQILGYRIRNFKIENLTISNVSYGIELLKSTETTIKNNVITSTAYGIYLYASKSNVIMRNSVNASYYVCYLKSSANNFIYDNEFLGDGYDDGTLNYWYNTRGNYWYEWAQTHNDSDGDGIIDDPYPIYGSYNADPAPLARSPLIKAPSAPLLSIQSGDGKMVLSWLAPENDGGSEILRYNIYRGTDVNSMSLLSSVDANITEYEDLSVENGQLYFYYVTAVNYAGEGEKSNTVSSMPVGKPSEPQHLVYSVLNDTVTLHWSAPLDNGGVDIKEYRVYRNGVKILSLSGTQTWCVDKNLEYGVTYAYWITAVNVAGESNASNTVEITLSSVPEAPANLSMEIVNESLYLHWVSGDSRGSDIIEYRIYRNGTLMASTQSNITWIVINGDFSGVYYVTAVNSVGESEPSTSVYVMNLQNESQNISSGDNSSNNTGQGYSNETVIFVSGANDIWLMIVAILEIGIIGSIWYLIIDGNRRSHRNLSGDDKKINEPKIENDDLNVESKEE